MPFDFGVSDGGQNPRQRDREPGSFAKRGADRKELQSNSFGGFSGPVAAETKQHPKGCCFVSGVSDGGRTHDLQGHNLAL